MPPDPLQVVRNRLKTDYPRPDLNPEWLSSCVRALQEADPSATVPTLIRSTESQLLLSDLSSSCLPNNSGLPSPDENGEYPLEAILFGPAKKDSCLVMITSIMEIGSSAFQLGTVKQQRAEALSGAAKIRRLRIGGEDRNGIGNEGEEEEEDEVEDGDIPPYPRGMLMLEVSDGDRYMRAMEYKRIGGLKLGETALGSKLLLRNVKSLRGILLLTPDNVTIKGHMVEEMEDLQGHYFENGLRVRMGKEPLDLPDDDATAVEAGSADPQPPARPEREVQHQQQQPMAGPSRTINMAQDGGAIQFMAIEDDEDDDYDMDMDADLLAAIEIEQAAATDSNARGGAGNQQRRPRSTRSNRRSARTDQSIDPFDFLEPDEDELEAVMAVERTQMAGPSPRESQLANSKTSRGANRAPVMAANAGADDEDDDDGMDWAALAEIDEEEIRAARFPDHQETAKSVGRAKRTLPARLQTALPSRGQSRSPAPATGRGPSTSKSAGPSSEAGESAVGEVSRFFAGTASGSKGKAKAKETDNLDGREMSSKQGKKRGAAARSYVDVDSDEDDNTAARRRGSTVNPTQPTGKTSSAALHGRDRALGQPAVGDDGDTSEDSHKENKRPATRKVPTRRTNGGPKPTFATAKQGDVIELSDDSE